MQVIDFLVDALLDDATLVQRLQLLLRACDAHALHGGSLDEVRSNVAAPLLTRLPKRDGGTMLHEAARAGNLQLLHLTLATRNATGLDVGRREPCSVGRESSSRPRGPLAVFKGLTA